MGSKLASPVFRASVAVIVLGGAIAPVAAAPSIEAERWMTLRLSQFATYGSEVLTRDDAYNRLIPAFDQADINGNGVSQSDFALAERIRLAQQRSSYVTMILRDDLDGDGRVTRSEFVEAHGSEARQSMMVAGGVRVEPTAAQTAEILRQVVERGLKADADRDGVITWTEMLGQAKAQEQEQQRAGANYRREMPIPMTLDENGDGTVSLAEYRALFDRVFAAVDTNHDGRLSSEERAALLGRSANLQQQEQAARQKEQEAEQAKGLAVRCGLPKLPASSKIVLLSAYEGQALSTVSLGGDDNEVSVVRVVVEPGREPLALVLTSYSSNIWLIDGATERVTNVVTSALIGDAQRRPRVGVVGVRRDKVTVAKSTECLRYASGDRPQPGVVAKAAEPFLGRSPDFAFAEYSMSTVAVPSGKLDKAAALPNTVAVRTTGPAAPVWALMMRYNPKGLVEIDPKRVVSDVKAARYAVLPQQAGLAQLVESGAIEVSGSDREIRLNGTSIVLGGGDDTIRGAQGQDFETSVVPSEFTIRKQITFPAGLNGGHSVKFILPDGVPEPLGSPGHSKVIRSK
ncbi:MAG: hypothetical protein ABL996_17865 [Micropepsaceae bacterium]